MQYEDALAQIEGAQSSGGQLIVHRGGKNILVGKHVQGVLIVEDNDEARAVMAELTVVASAEVEVEVIAEVEVEEQPPAPVTHEVAVKDEVVIGDKPPGRRR